MLPLFAFMLLLSIGIFTHNAFADQVVTVIPEGLNPKGVAVNPTTNMIYARDVCVCGGNSPLGEINGSTNVIQNSIGTTTFNGNVAVNPNTNKIYFSNSYPGPNYSVSVLDGSTNTIVTNIPVGGYGSGNPGGIAVNQNTNRIYVSDNDGLVYVIDGLTNSVVSKINAGDGKGIAVNSNTNMIYVSNLGSNSTSVINGSTNTVVSTTIPVGWGPDGIAVDSTTNMIYVANYWGGTVSVIDGTTNNVVTTLPLSHSPDGIAVNPNTGKIYISLGNYTISVINDKTYAVMQDISTTQPPWGIGINPNTDRIYVAEDGINGNLGTGHVIVIQGNSSDLSSGKTIEFSSNTSFSGIVNASDTLIIDKGVTLTSDGITNYGHIKNYGNIGNLSGVRMTIDNYGTILNFDDGQIWASVTNNYKSGIVVNQNLYGGLLGQRVLNNYGNFTTYGGIRAEGYSYINNYATGVIASHGSSVLQNSKLNNYGKIDSYGYFELDWSSIYNNGTFNNHANISLFPVQGGDAITNGAAGIFNNLAGSQVSIPSRAGGYSFGFFNYGTVNNAGTFSNQDRLKNWGIFENNGTISNTDGAGYPCCVIPTITNYGTLHNNLGGTIDNNGIFNNECQAVYDNNGTFNGNAAIGDCTTNQEVSINPTNGPTGTQVTVAGNNFKPNYSIALTFDSWPVTTTPSRITSNSTGGFTATFSIPSTNFRGQYIAQNSVHNVAPTDGTYSATSTFTVTAPRPPTTTTITVSSNKTIPENPFTFSATVVPSSATGTIQFKVDGTNLESTVTLSGGTASLTASLPTGTHDITASYSGDSNFAPSVSAPFTITVQTPALATQGVINVVNNMTLTQGTTTSLDAKLDATISYLNANDPANAKSALLSFISEVNAQTGKHITQAQADQLVMAARNIIKAIS